VGTIVDVDLRVLARRRWLRLAVLAGVAVVVVAAIVAGGRTGLDRTDTFREACATLLLLGGLIMAVSLGGGAFSRDAHSGFLGLMVGNGATPSQVGAGRIVARVTALVAVMALWAVAMQGASLAIGEGLDGPLLVHALTAVVNALLVLCASCAMASVIGPGAAGVFGIMVFVSAQAAVNLKAALDQGGISQDSATLINTLYTLFPRALVSPMISEMQARDVAGPAAPQIDINGILVVVPASTWITVAWTLAWCVALASLAAYGVRRRQL
jgi:hypothetical protein